MTEKILLIITIVSITSLFGCNKANTDNKPTYSISDKECVIGTWQQTYYGRKWYKYIIKNDETYESYFANPQDGKWTFLKRGNWIIKNESGRSAADGTKYNDFYLVLDYSEPNSFGEKRGYEISSCDKINFRDGMLTKTDENPWKD